MTSAEFIQVGEQIANLHRCRIEDAPGSGGSPPLRRGQATVERLPDYGGDGCTALPRERANPLVALIVDENLQPMSQHTHTLACACGAAALAPAAPCRGPFGTCLAECGSRGHRSRAAGVVGQMPVSPISAGSPLQHLFTAGAMSSDLTAGMY